MKTINSLDKKPLGLSREKLLYLRMTESINSLRAR